MRRIKKITLILFFIMLFIPLTKVNAATCANVKEAVNNLKEIESSYIENNCDEATTDSLIAKCNGLAVRKSATLKQIFEYNANKTCPSINLTSTVEKYSDVCTDELNSELRTLVDTVMKFFYITAPFILVIFGSLDFFKIMVGNPSEIKKHRTNFIKRVIAFLLLYTTPFFVKTIFSITPYNIDTTTYICSQEISFTPKVTSEALSGTYEGYDNTVEITTGGSYGQRIADGAKQVKADAKKNNYHYDCNYLSASAQGTNKTDHMCCAELVGGALYRAKIYSSSELKSIHSASAPTITRNLIKKGWKVIWNKNKLQAGDVIVYQKVVPCSSCGLATIEGKTYKTAHVEIYAGNKKAYGAGSTDALKSVTNNFWTTNQRLRFLCGLRYNGK